MSTIGYQLNILRDTQMVQRRLLEKQFPYIDWAKMPFSSYGDFFRLRGILDDCGAVWTNAYGRSNDEAESTRKYLKDYSGNDRDIELFNFGYSKQSGYNGYPVDFRTGWNFGVQVNANSVIISECKVQIKTNSGGSSTGYAFGAEKTTFYQTKSYKAKITFEGESTINVKMNISDGNTIYEYIAEFWAVKSGDIIKVPVLTAEQIEDSTKPKAYWIFENIPKSGVIVEVLPDYQGALVSDGIDDYGQCVKDFALPNDYTVVAMREHLSVSNLSAGATALISKSALLKSGAFQFDNIDVGPLYKVVSYGGQNSNVHVPTLFSYLSKTSYNGVAISAGSALDTENDKLILFKIRPETSSCLSAALYSFGIFTRTLTDEELRIVENCMYAEWIAMTGKLEDIEYYDILDARFRSNEEDADKRNRWTGRLGKLHMTLNNYAYSQMSGWGGWPLVPFDKLNYTSNSDASENKVKVTKMDGKGWICYIPANESIRTMDWKIKIHNPFGKVLYLIYINSSSLVKSVNLNEGVNIIPPATEEFTNVAFNMNAFSIGEYIEVEQLPLYGGALVSDGVDDNAVSDEVIDEEIGGVVCHVGYLGGVYIFGAKYIDNSIWGYHTSGTIWIGDKQPGDNKTSEVQYTPNRDLVAFSRAPAIPNNRLALMASSVDGPANGKCALYQLRLIKTQPTYVQLEAIKWQCRKEHEDYLIHMGWKEVE